MQLPDAVEDVEEYLSAASSRHRSTVGLLNPLNLSRLATYLSFIRFSHSVFALPFALTGALLAWRIAPFEWRQILWVIVAMVSARSAAMGFNRLVDARLDALNPRTAAREIPRGVLSRRDAAIFVVITSAIFVVAAFQLNRICGLLSPVALAIVFWYSLAKRFTSYTQAFLGSGHGGGAGRRVAGGGWADRRAGAVVAGAGDRVVGGRLRHPVCVPGPGLRSRARVALDPGAVSAWRGRS